MSVNSLTVTELKGFIFRSFFMWMHVINRKACSSTACFLVSFISNQTTDSAAAAQVSRRVDDLPFHGVSLSHAEVSRFSKLVLLSGALPKEALISFMMFVVFFSIMWPLVNLHSSHSSPQWKCSYPPFCLHRNDTRNALQNEQDNMALYLSQQWSWRNSHWCPRSITATFIKVT